MGTLKSPMSQVLSDTSLKVFFGTKAWESCTPAFLLGGGGGGGYNPVLALLRHLC